MGYGISLGFLLWLLHHIISVRPNSRGGGVLLLFTIGIASNATAELLASALIYGSPTSSYPLIAAAGPVSTFGLLVVSATLGQLDQDWKLINAVVTASAEELESSANDLRFASFLHNSLQSELNGIALSLGKASGNQSAEVTALLERLEKIASEPITDRYRASQLRGREYLDALVSAWEPLVKIDLSLEGRVEQQANFGLLIELLEESISNAVRHAGAKQISIGAKLEADNITVSIVHRAPNKIDSGNNLGSGWLVSHAKSHKLETENGMRKLTVIL